MSKVDIDVFPELPFEPHRYKRVDGTTVSFDEFIYYRMRSAFIIDPWHEANEWKPFSYRLGEVVPGSADTKANEAHTNAVRDGTLGLPRDWEMLVFRWRAALNMAPAQPILDWAAETVVRFVYNSKFHGNENLADLIFGPQPLEAGNCPVHMRENLNFYAEVRTDNEKVLSDLKQYLRDDPDESTRRAVVELDALANIAKEFNTEPVKAIVAGIRRVQTNLQKGTQLTVWLSIEGPLKRVII